MVITKGSDKYTFVDVSAKELSNVFDAFQYWRIYLIGLLEKDNTEIAKALSVKASEMPTIRKVMEEKVLFYEKQQKKIMSYAKK